MGREHFGLIFIFVTTTRTDARTHAQTHTKPVVIYDYGHQAITLNIQNKSPSFL